MQRGEIAAGLTEMPEVSGGADARDARQFLAQVVSVAFAVIGGMQDAVDVIEQVFLADRFKGIGAGKMGETGISDGVAAVWTMFGLARE